MQTSQEKWILTIIIIISTCAIARAQIPDKFTNLQVFPKDIGQRELINQMRGFARGLGVRCQHCHVGEGNDFSTYDFASDEKPTKRAARIMTRMRNEINQKFLTQLTNRTDGLQVECVTCHHGQPRPLTLEHILTQTIQEAGIDSAIQKYHQLRQRYYGGFTYDFQERTLNNLGYVFLQQDKVNEAIALFKLNVEMYPESANVYDSLGEAYMHGGQKELAIVNYEKSLQLNPKNENATKMLEKLRAN